MNLRTALHLGIITSLGSLLVLLVSEYTQDARAENHAQALQSTLMELMASDVTVGFVLDADLPDHPFALCDTEGALEAALIPGVAAGYAGEIVFIAAVDATGRVTGVRVTRHAETPGIGDIIDRDKSDWIDTLKWRSRNDTVWALTRDGGEIDGVSGATITLRGLLGGVGETLSEARPRCSA